MKTLTIKGIEYRIVREFAEPGIGVDGSEVQRCIIDMEGANVMADGRADGSWEFGGPARPGPELEAMNALTKDGTTVTVTAPD